ncbi:hypothetical protein J8F10_06025 [Gemmata sp. G18]|uniref:TubC N-terminal docking domain-containing protein n=1 Tax=Gemmata palustris TaxID=2822762 RepID=A0ABS5BM93_9BACT|nr:hypothetical protein [Gemmata palustris]MBP3954839.1 hypothetical protein [Gemmata palustris]
MTVPDAPALVRWLAERGIVLIPEGAALRVRSRAPLGAAIRDRIRAHKPALLAHLTRPVPDAGSHVRNRTAPEPVPNADLPSEGRASNIRHFRAENSGPTGSGPVHVVINDPARLAEL